MSDNDERYGNDLNLTPEQARNRRERRNQDAATSRANRLARENERLGDVAAHLEAALDLLVKNDIHGGLPNGYCAVCQGQCTRTWR